MVCDSVTGVECVLTATNEFNVKLLLFFIYLAISMFFILYMNREKIESFGKFFITLPMKVIRMLSFLYLYLLPLNIVMLSIELPYEVYLGYYLLYWAPISALLIVLFFVYGINLVFEWIGYDSAMDFYNKIKR